MNKLKRAAALLSILICTFCLCSCGSLLSLREKQLNLLASEESGLITEQSNEIIRCLTERDKERFAALFCEEVRQSSRFADDIDAVFAYFPCEAYITSQIDDFAGGTESREGGKRTEWSLSPEIPYIQILQPSADDPEDLDDRYYGVRYNWTLVDEEHPEWVGLRWFSITLLNTDDSVGVGLEDE